VQRLSELMGKAIVTADTGEKLGTVADVLLDDDGARVAGVVVRGGWMSKERVLPYEGVQTLGRDAVVVRSGRELMDVKEWRGRAATNETVADPAHESYRHSE
jgi:uncharacterized protein YrrD